MCTQFQSNPLNICQDVLLEAKNVNLLVALEEKVNSRIIHRGPNFMTIHLIDFILDHTSGPTDRAMWA